MCGCSQRQGKSAYRLQNRITDKIYWTLPCDTIFMKIRSLSLEIKNKLWKTALSRNVGESFRKFPDVDPEADDFQNVISSSVTRDTFVVKFS